MKPNKPNKPKRKPPHYCGPAIVVETHGPPCPHCHGTGFVDYRLVEGEEAMSLWHQMVDPDRASTPRTKK